MNEKKKLIDLKTNLNEVQECLNKVNEKNEIIHKNYHKVILNPYSEDDDFMKLEQNIDKVKTDIKELFVPELEKEINS